jgi:Lipid A 3-O-deacylase (PagL)
VCLAAGLPAHSQDFVSETDSNPAPAAGALTIASPPAEASLSATPQTAAEFSSSSESLAVPPFNTIATAEAGQVRQVTQETPIEKVEQELIVGGLVSYGNYKIFASGYDEKLFDVGVEYDRHSWGYLLKAQFDYAAEFLPFILLDKPLYTDIFGNPDPQKEKNIRQHVPGIGIFPIGFRMQWRSKKAIKPYFEAKGGMIAFTKKVPSTEAAYENFSLQTATGVQVKMSDRWGLRLGLFSDFHFSDGFVVPVNPGLDVMNANLGLSYHF